MSCTTILIRDLHIMRLGITTRICEIPSRRLAHFKTSEYITKSSDKTNKVTLSGMKLLVDTDPGTDDCHALTHLLKLGNVKAITTVFGNSSQPRTAHNACRILDMLGMNHIPVFNGAQCSLQATDPFVEIATRHWDGSDCMNDAPDCIPMNVSKQPEKDKTAPDAIISIVKANPGEITLVALGPLTNIAIATRLCPELPSLIKSFYVMGSNYGSKVGNATQWAEFNFRNDPLAAHITLKQFCKHSMVHVVPREPCFENCITFEQYDSMFEGTKDSPAKSLLSATGMTEKLISRRTQGRGYRFSDQFISMIIVYPESVIKSEYYDTMDILVYDKVEEKRGLADYVIREGPENKEHGLIVYTKFDMNYMMKLYRNSMIV